MSQQIDAWFKDEGFPPEDLKMWCVLCGMPIAKHGCYTDELTLQGTTIRGKLHCRNPETIQTAKREMAIFARKAERK